MSMLDDIDENELLIENEEETELNEIPRELRKLRTQPYDKSVFDLVAMIQRGDIILRPDFQRNAVWDQKRASLLIESIWLNIPIPQIFVSVEEDGKWNVIDGQQRLTSLKKFFDNEYAIKGLEVLPELNKQKYSTLEEKPKRLLGAGNIRIVAIHEDSHPDIKFDVFMRINQGAIQLNAQELRNCLYRGSLNSLLHKLKENKHFLSILNLNQPHNRFKDAEIILRYLAISESAKTNLEDYPGVMKKFLNNYMLKNRECSLGDQKSITQKFNATVDNVHTVFGNNAFRKWDPTTKNFEKALNLSLMDSQMIALEGYPLADIKKHKAELLNAFKNIFECKKDDFIRSITSTTSSKINLNKRIDLLKTTFNSILRGQQ